VTPGTQLRVTVTALDDEGAGVAAVPAGEGSAPLELRIAGTLPGEAVTARIEHVSNHRPLAWATLLSIETVAPTRVTPACLAYGRCGGCVLQHFDYAAQVAWKEQALRALVAGQPTLDGVPVLSAVASPAPFGYRNKSKLVPAREADGRLVLGAYAPRSHHVVDLAGCAIAQPPLDQVAAALRDVLDEQGVLPYDERRLSGTLRYVVLRASADGHVLAVLVTAAQDFPAGAAVAAALQARRPEVRGVVQNINPSRGNVLFGATEVTLAGDRTLADRIGEVRLCVSPQAFFQANRAVAALAYQAIAEGLAPAPGDVVVDAYAGIGGIALGLAPRVARVIGIEEHPAAVEDAALSAAWNGITNATFVVGDVAERLAAVEQADLVVLNPPRKGCAPAVLDQAAALHPRALAYLSCNPETLLRDLTLLHQRGYRTQHLTPFDMLPHTPHLEALAILARVPSPFGG
jgi:23S rRNA (uracil1939-C5)-methyltransferase